METKMAFCATCDRPVKVVVKPDPTRQPDDPIGADDVVCLEHGETCGAGTICPIFDIPSETMKENLRAHRSADQEGA